MSKATKRPAARWPAVPASPFARISLRVGGWTPQQLAEVREESESLELELGALLSEGAAPESAAVQRAIAAWAKHVSRFCSLTPELFLGLGQHYVAHPAFRARYDAIEPGLAVFLRDAIARYCRDFGESGSRAAAPAGWPDVGRSLP